MNSQLGLHEELLLLALRDQEGTVDDRASYYQYALAGGVLCELMASGLVTVSPEAPHWVDVVPDRGSTDARITADPVLRESLAAIHASKRRILTEWVSRLSSDKDLRHPVAQLLCDRRILEHRQEKVMLMFSRSTYPTVDPSVESELVRRLRSGLGDGPETLDERTRSLAALAAETGLLKMVFEPEQAEAHSSAISRLKDKHPVADAVREVKETDQMIGILIAVT